MYKKLLKNQLKRWWKHLIKNFHTRWQARKMRIADAVLFNESKVTLLTSIYRLVLPIFKKHVMPF